MKSRHLAAVLAFLIMAAFVGGAAVSFLDVSGSVTVVSNTGVEVTTSDHGGGLGTGETFPADDTVQLQTQNGNVTVSGSGAASLRVDQLGGSDIAVQNLSSGTTNVTIAPEGADTLTLNGSADSFVWSTIAADDGSAEFSAAFGPSESATVYFGGLSPNTDYQVRDGNGNRLAAATADGTGDASFSISSNSSYTLQTYDNPAPSVTNIEPKGEVLENTVELNATIDDDSLPGSDVDLVYRVNGNVVEQRTITSAGEQSYTLTQAELPGSGSHDWSITATDELAAETTATGSFGIAANFTVRNVSNASETIPNAEVTFVLENGTVTRTSDANGNVSMTGLPGGTRIPVTVNATDYYSRTTVIPTIVQASDAFLLPQNETTVLNRFTLTDATGSYTNNATVILERPVPWNGNNDFRRVAGDEFGVEGFPATLKQDQRYRIIIKSQDGDVAQLGKYIATTSQEVPLRPDGPTVALDDDSVIGYNASVESGTLSIEYRDPQEQTDVLEVYVVNRFNSSDYLLKPKTYYGTNSLTIAEPVGQLNESYIVVLDGQRDGEPFRATLALGPDQRNVVPGDLSLPWIQFLGIGMLLLVGGSFSRLNLGAGVVVTSSLAGVLWYIGLLQGVATWATVALAITFSVIYAMVIQR